MLDPLPVDSILPDVLLSVRSRPITIVQAPPGSGKTTRVPAYLMRKLDVQAVTSSSNNSRKMLLLQPRRIAVQSVANRIAAEEGQSVGEDIGYAIRFDARVSPSTKLLVCTEGILLRKLSDDITLSDVSVVIFDEFHERSLDSDLLLTMCRHLQATLRPDLKIVIMSATISAEELGSRFESAAVHRAEGTMYPVEIKYRPSNPRDRLSEVVAQAVAEAIAKHSGDILVFLPGKGEIFQTQSTLSHILPREIEVLPLFGAMTIEQQAAVVRPSPSRRVILATNIAETSLTIEGIRVVIDCGLARVMRFDPATGLDRLSLEAICRASADQRAGRAGRVAPGTTYRLWSQASQNARPAYLEPEIHRVDFSSSLLRLLLWNEPNVAALPWIDPPGAKTLEAATKLLERLGAIELLRVTTVGEMMGRLPLHPRIARLVYEASLNGYAAEACFAAAMITERDPFVKGSNFGARSNSAGRNPNTFRRAEQPFTKEAFRWNCDVVERLEAIEGFKLSGNPVTKFGEVHRNSLQQIERVAEQVFSEASSLLKGIAQPNAEPEIVLRKAFLKAFPDRLARRRERGKERALMVGGKGVKLSPDSGVVQSELFVCLDVDAGGVDATVRKASAVERDWLEGENLRSVDEMFYSPTQAAVQCRRRTYWIDLCIEESPAAVTDHDGAAEILAAAVIADWKRYAPADQPDMQNLLGRIKLLTRYEPTLNWPQIDTGWLQRLCKQICRSMKSLHELRNADWTSYIRNALSGEQAAALARLAPPRMKVASGREFPIDYTQEQPSLSLKIQDAFGMRENPRLVNGKVILQLHLLAPNQRPQQITNDLASFWANGYPTVKKELKRRYAKHAWPDDPISGV